MPVSTRGRSDEAPARLSWGVPSLLIVALIALSLWWGFGKLQGIEVAIESDLERPSADAWDSGRPTGGNARIEPRRQAGVTLIDPEESAENLVFSAKSAADGLRLARERFGDDSYSVNMAKLAVNSLCGRGVDPRGSLQHGSADPTRDWVIESTLAYCAGWTAEGFKVMPSRDAPDSLLVVLREQGEVAASQVAREQISSSSDASTLHEAALYLFERGELPSSGSGGLGPVDASMAIAFAARLVACEATASCGPGSPLTLSYCVREGCTPGVSFLDAMRENMAANDFALMQWYYLWMNSQRIGGG